MPTPLAGLTVNPEESSCARSNVPTGDQLDAAVDNNMLALLVAATLMLVVAYVFAVARTGLRPPSLAWWGRFDHSVFWLEAVLTTLFGAFWVVQSKELWSVAARAASGQPARNGSAG